MEMMVAAVQMEAPPFELDRNLAVAGARIEEAAHRGAKLIVLPEFFHIGYTFDTRLRDHAEAVDGRTASWLRQWSRRTGACIGGCIVESRVGRLHDTFVLAHPDGNLSSYRKRFPAFFENTFFHAGTEIGIVQTCLGRIGIMICWDMIHLRLAKELTGKIDLLIISAAWPNLRQGSMPLPGFSHWISRQPIRQPMRLAAKLGVPVVFSNHSGPFSIRVPGLRFRYQSPFAAHSAVIESDGSLVNINRDEDDTVCGQVRIKTPGSASRFSRAA